MHCNLKNLEDLTGITFKTLKKKLEAAEVEPVKTSPKGNFYDSVQALKALYLNQSTEELDLQKERAKLAQAQTKKTQLEAKKLEGELVCAEDVQQTWSNHISNARTKLLLLPLKICHDLTGIEDAKVIEERIEEAIYEALAELSQEVNSES